MIGLRDSVDSNWLNWTDFRAVGWVKGADRWRKTIKAVPQYLMTRLLILQ